MNPGEISRRGWTVVADESGAHFSPEEHGSFASACQSSGVTELLVCVLDWEGAPTYLVPATEAGIRAMYLAVGMLEILIVPRDKELFVFVGTKSNYILLAGQRGFVVSALGSEPAEVWNRFRSYSEEAFWTADERRRYKEVIDRYAPEAR